MKKTFEAFVLVEAAILLIILGLLSSIFFPTLKNLQNYIEAQKRDKTFDEIYSALQVFYLNNNRLPYASADFSGNETLYNLSGFIPYKSIAIQRNGLQNFSYILSKKMQENSPWSKLSDEDFEGDSQIVNKEIKIFSEGFSLINSESDDFAFVILYGLDKNNFDEESLLINENDLHNKKNLMWKSINNFKMTVERK